MKRSLSLRRETLAPLTDGDLVSVAGGQYTSPDGVSCGVMACATVVNETLVLTTVLLPTQRCATTNCPTLLC